MLVVSVEENPTLNPDSSSYEARGKQEGSGKKELGKRGTSRMVEEHFTVAFLGPKGSYCHQVCLIAFLLLLVRSNLISSSTFVVILKVDCFIFRSSYVEGNHLS